MKRREIRADEGVDLNSLRSGKHRRRKSGSSTKRVLITILCVTLAVLTAITTFTFVYIKTMLGRIDRVDVDSDIGITSDALETYSNYTTIALFGLDTRKNNDTGRSDAIILITFDKEHNKIKMTSIARDTYVEMQKPNSNGTSKLVKDKITHAWMFGKHNLAIKTINANFDLNVQDFVSMNFFQFADIIDYIGGVDIDVSSAEMKVMNRDYIPYLNSYGIKCSRVTKTGLQRLSGGQALAYSRDRYTGSDLERGGRQREVLMAMYERVKNLSITKYPSLIEKVLDLCSTSLDDGEMMDLAMWAATSRPTFEQLGLPNDVCKAKGSTINGTWYFVYDLDVASKEIQDFIHETGEYAPNKQSASSASKKQEEIRK